MLELGLLPVDQTIPEGQRQDYSQGPTTARGWQIVNGVVVPITVPVEPPQPEPVPESVRKAQLQQWLIDQDMLSSVESVFTANHPIWQGNDKARLKAQARWEYEVNVRRDDPLVNAFIPLLGLTAEQVDEAFRYIEANYP